MILADTRERTRFIRFVVVGSIGFVVDFGTLNLLTLVFLVPAVPASILSFMAAVSSNFIWNRYWTYPDSRSKRVRRQLAQFSLVSITGLLIRTPIFAILLSFFTFMLRPLGDVLPLSAEVLSHNLALAGAVIVVMFWNFFINRYWTYGDVDKEFEPQK
ncbi:MAG: GtrA family protein [Anaerolineales bacterium]|nr:GtrA family protein [Anaerolineales bacterium]